MKRDKRKGFIAGYKRAGPTLKFTIKKKIRKRYGTFVPSVLGGKIEGDRSSRACTGLADYDQIAYALHEMFHGAKSLRQTLWAKRILGTFGTNVPYDYSPYFDRKKNSIGFN